MIKTDCFGYTNANGKDRCAKLTKMLCKDKKCKFYKTTEKDIKDKEKAKERIESKYKMPYKVYLYANKKEI